MQNATGLIYRLLLVFSESCMSSVCLFYEMQFIEVSFLHSMADFNKIRYRAVIEFFSIMVVYCENAPSCATVKRWTAEFHGSLTNLEDDPRSGRPYDAVCEDKVITKMVIRPLDGPT